MSEKSDLVKLFTEAFCDVGSKGQLIGNTILVSRLPKREVKTAGGLVLSKHEKFQVNSWDSNQPEFVKVLAVGEGYYNPDTGETTPVDLKPGNIIQIGKSSVNWFSSWGAIFSNPETGTGIGLTLESETKVKFEDEDSFNKFMNHFGNSELAV